MDKRAYFNSKAFKAILAVERPLTACCNCKATDGLVWHHIVPLAQGGTNEIGNIAVVCSTCYKAIHGEKEARMYKASLAGGRKPIIPDNCETVLDRYFNCQIGKSEAESLLNLNGKLNDYKAVSVYKERKGIAEHRNNIDLIRKKDGSLVNRPVGYIRHNGETERTYLNYSEN